MNKDSEIKFLDGLEAMYETYNCGAARDIPAKLRDESSQRSIRFKLAWYFNKQATHLKRYLIHQVCKR